MGNLDCQGEGNLRLPSPFLFIGKKVYWMVSQVCRSPYFQQVLHFSQSYDEKERYNLLPKSYPNLDQKSPYYGSNCASFVASILRYTGATLEQITQAADAQGIDVGEKRLVPRNHFNP